MSSKNKSSKIKPNLNNIVATNKKAKFDFSINDTYEAGIQLSGWEVKSLRSKKVQILDSFVTIKNQEAWLLNCQITPLNTASTHVITEPARTRKLLLHKKQIAKLSGLLQIKGNSLVPLSLYWIGPRIKLKFAVATGKKNYDKRHAIKDRDWQQTKRRILKYQQQ